MAEVRGKGLTCSILFVCWTLGHHFSKYFLPVSNSWLGFLFPYMLPEPALSHPFKNTCHHQVAPPHTTGVWVPAGQFHQELPSTEGNYLAQEQDPFQGRRCAQ